MPWIHFQMRAVKKWMSSGTLVVIPWLMIMAATHEHAFDQATKRAVTVADIIGLNRITSSLNFAAYSPDASHLAFVLTKGDLATNTNVSSLYTLDISSPVHPSAAKLVISFRSSSNREAISRPTWLHDNDTILFLAENPDETTQVYAVGSRSGTLRKLTSHPTNVTSYSASNSGDRIVYAAEKLHSDQESEEGLRRGVNVSSDDDLSQLIRGEHYDDASDKCELFLQSADGKSVRRVKVSGGLIFSAPDLFMAPNGRFLILRTLVTHTDPQWKRYQDPVLQNVLSRDIPRGGQLLIERYEIVDAETLASTTLIDAPVGYEGSNLLWSPDSSSVIVTGVHLPLEGDANTQNRRQAHTFVAEVMLADRRVSEISVRQLTIPEWSGQTGILQLEAEREPDAASPPQSRRWTYFKKGSKGWKEVDAGQASATLQEHVFIDENLDLPPRIVVENEMSHRQFVLVDPNPDISKLALGQVREVIWRNSQGAENKGALYLPPDYVPGKRYPLVIQTHGYDPHKFWIDGPYSTAFAAQPLVSKGIVVLQMSEVAIGATDEGAQNMKAFESAIDFLDAGGFIDREKIGLIGFSRTCYHVKYALTHSKIRFAAASIADGMDAGYFQYLVFANENRNLASEYEHLLGGAPFGNGLSAWMKESPGFLLDRVTTPLEIQSIGPASLLAQWEWFSGLSRLGKPVYQLYIPDGTHVLQKPWDRMSSQQSNVDWFGFWLKAEEDPDPSKQSQYERWRQLRFLVGKRSESRVPPGAL
jgi:hypothetical protein